MAATTVEPPLIDVRLESLTDQAEQAVAELRGPPPLRDRFKAACQIIREAKLLLKSLDYNQRIDERSISRLCAIANEAASKVQDAIADTNSKGDSEILKIRDGLVRHHRELNTHLAERSR